MADTKKTTRSKKTVIKAAVPSAKVVAAEAKPQITPPAVKAAVKPAPVAAPATKAATVVIKPAPAPAPAPKAAPKSISKDDFFRMVEQAAYYVAEKNGFQGDSAQHWQDAEAEVRADLKKRNITVA